jgi:tripartite-type tricarboxylate transporter receptor subunit TctC
MPLPKDEIMDPRVAIEPSAMLSSQPNIYVRRKVLRGLAISASCVLGTVHCGFVNAQTSSSQTLTALQTLRSSLDIKTVKIIVPFAPGGSGDITARLLAEQIQRRGGPQVIVENKPGANGIIGADAAKRSAADGSVLMLATTSTHSANPSLYRQLPYDPVKDFVLVGHFGTGSTLVLVKPDAPFQTLAEFVSEAKRKPGQLHYGYFNASSQVPGALIGQLAGIELQPVAYKQIANAMTDLMAGHLQVIFVDSVAGDSYASSGKLRVIATAGTKRLPKYPHIALITESYPSYDLSGFLGVALPIAAPEAIRKLWNQVLNEIILSEPMKSTLERYGFHPKSMSLQDLGRFVNDEQARWKRYVALAKIEPQ